MACLSRFGYKYLGMNYSRCSETGRTRFEYIYRNPQTVWISFSLYPATKKKAPECFGATLVSPFRRDELNLITWFKGCSHRLDFSRFDQFDGSFEKQAAALVALLDAKLNDPGLNAVLEGRSAVDIPSLSLNG